MKITKSKLKQIIKEELNRGEGLAMKSLIEQGKTFFDQVIELSKASEDNPSAAEQLSTIEQALSREVEEKSNGYVKFIIIG
mgnify:CR=1 FL=1